MTDKLHLSSGHGHVIPSGKKMRCGGPGLCKGCNSDLELLDNDYVLNHIRIHERDLVRQKLAEMLLQLKDKITENEHGAWEMR